MSDVSSPQQEIQVNPNTGVPQQQSQQPQQSQPPQQQQQDTSGDTRSEEQKKVDLQLAERLSSIIEDANKKVTPLCRMIRQHIERFESLPEDDRDEKELVRQVKPLLEQSQTVLDQTWGAVKGADPDNRLSNKAQRNMQDHKATPEEQRLAEALKTVIHRFILVAPI